MEIYEGVSSLLKAGQKTISMKYTLNSGTSMPIVGYGTYLVKSHQIFDTINAALSYGYRNIDTAAVYNNEEAIGQALKQLLPKYGLKREDIFITTKLSPKDMSETRVKEAVNWALHNLGVSYIDLFLIHWPGAQGISVSNTQNPRFRMETWKELIRLHDKGRGVLRAIGVSNFLAKHVEQIITLTGVPPAVNQVEFHPFYNHSKELYEVCLKHNILLQAYSSFGGTGNSILLEHPLIRKYANTYGVSPAQVLLRWALQVGYAIIPKSVSQPRIKINSELDFELDKETMNHLSSLHKEINEKFAWDPSDVM